MPASGAMDAVVTNLWAAVVPQLWWIALLAIGLLVLQLPAVGRGPRSTKRDPWRGFKFAARAAVMDRAGGRCEAPLFFAWGRCSSLATDADHIMPWSRGGPTVVSNGQALCRGHNRSKSAFVPPWWYIHGLERRRRDYFSAGTSVRVLAVMDEADRAARERSPRAARERGRR